MTATTETPAIGVGVPITSVEQLNALPLEAVLTYTSPITSAVETYTKIGEGRWRVSSSPTLAWDNAHFDMSGTNVITSLPTCDQHGGAWGGDETCERCTPEKAVVVIQESDDTPPPTPVPQVGDTLFRVEQYQALPVDAIVKGRRAWHRTENGFQSPGGSNRSVETIAQHGPMVVTFVPNRAMTEEQCTAPAGDYSQEVETTRFSLELFKQRFQTIVMGAQQVNGVDPTYVERGLSTLGVETQDTITAGMYASCRDEFLLGTVPEGTVLQYGDPSNWEGYGLWGVDGDSSGDLTLLLGSVRPSGNMAARIVSIPDGPEPPEWVHSSDSEQDLYEWCKQAWRVALSVKDDTGWCSELELAVHAAGVGPWVEREEPLLTAEQVAELPVGSILRVIDVSGGTALLRRVDGANNPAGTMRVGGTLRGHWAKSAFKVFDPAWNRSLRIHVSSHEEMMTMPVGTTIADGYGGVWVRREVDANSRTPRACWFSHSNDYGYTPEQFSLHSMGYVNLP